MLQIEIDNGSGFCFGVTTAIKKAEEELAKGTKLYCLGDIVHNSMEVERLTKKGLITINHEQMRDLHNVKVLLRAHGEPPETYELAKRNNIEIIDATCPVVLALQRRIKSQYEKGQYPAEISLENKGERVVTLSTSRRIDTEYDEAYHPSSISASLSTQREVGSEASIVIFGKNGHAEVLGLVGQTHSHAIVIEKFEDVKSLDFNHDIYLYSQTTKSLDEFHKIIDYIQSHISPTAKFQSFDTICRQVANRMPNISSFAARHDLILFVAGRKSSNGKVLFHECLSVNPNSHQVESADEIDMKWFEGVQTVGICGATSTPKWLMEECRDEILRHT
ncbi:4-hydroxy-3-methylbut-2-enyl diphosphate reductase [Prevotella sp. A2879]|jgi:lytB protein|uniref:4-hydroxy-3-methylbut-2-enyl diphosphate reductase n=1 Tax=Prevotella vespertina TaxID=2608404 RepID=A0A7C9LTD6_9BACT|nr:4-hydroxy-3-methylbut-2-enyl diphosphate reductase [Prevotella vespertina]MUL27859.1 4-hydroxy-3-methylbut-2-enyl diphosphate reductase [Prevotella vespertina]